MWFNIPDSDLFQSPLFSPWSVFCVIFILLLVFIIKMTFFIFCFTALLGTCHFFYLPFLFLLMANEIIIQIKIPAITTYKSFIWNLIWNSEGLWQHGDTLAFLECLRENRIFMSLGNGISWQILSHWSGGVCAALAEDLLFCLLEMLTINWA